MDFAAPGADMAAAMLSPAFAAVRGTSFAAPIVAGLLAEQMVEPMYPAPPVIRYFITLLLVDDQD